MTMAISIFCGNSPSHLSKSLRWRPLASASLEADKSASSSGVCRPRRVDDCSDRAMVSGESLTEPMRALDRHRRVNREPQEYLG